MLIKLFVPKKAVGQTTSNDLVNIADVHDSVLHTKDNKMFVFLRIQPIPVALMTEEEKAQHTQQLTRELSPLDLPFKITLVSRSTDVKPHIENIEGIRSNQTDPVKRDILFKNIKYLGQMASSAVVMERQAYLCLFVDKTPQHTKDYLLEKSLEYIRALQNCKITCSMLNEKEVINLCHMALNPYNAVSVSVSTQLPTWV